MKTIEIKRIYDSPSLDDGVRILVDRLWPRGVSKERAHLDYWFKDIAPSKDLREWFGHKPELFPAFSKKYLAELEFKNPDKDKELEEIKDFLKTKNVTLLYAAKDTRINHAIVLKQFIEKK